MRDGWERFVPVRHPGDKPLLRMVICLDHVDRRQPRQPSGKAPYQPASAKLSAIATAFSIALDLFTVSWNSPSGVESFTQPPPTCT